MGHEFQRTKCRAVGSCEAVVPLQKKFSIEKWIGFRVNGFRDGFGIELLIA
jgi:hypothetical protein